MVSAPRPKLGFVSPSNRWGAHYDEFLALIPDGIDAEIEPLGLYGASLDELEGKLEAHANMTARLVRERGWLGIALMGAPMEVQNPGFAGRVRQAVAVPVTTALESGAAGLRALGVRKALLLTPFDARLKELLKEHLAAEGIEAVLPADSFSAVDRAAEQTPDQVYELARDRLSDAAGVEGIYFQGAPLNPLPVIERIEGELGVPVVASNPAMLWHLCVKLDLEFSITGKGRLLREWPAPVAP